MRVGRGDLTQLFIGLAVPELESVVSRPREEGPPTVAPRQGTNVSTVTVHRGHDLAPDGRVGAAFFAARRIERAHIPDFHRRVAARRGEHLRFRAIRGAEDRRLVAREDLTERIIVCRIPRPYGIVLGTGEQDAARVRPTQAFDLRRVMFLLAHSGRHGKSDDNIPGGGVPYERSIHPARYNMLHFRIAGMELGVENFVTMLRRERFRNGDTYLIGWRMWCVCVRGGAGHGWGW